MTCLNFGPLQLPEIPDFLLAPPLLQIPLPVGVVLCCKFELNSPALMAALAALNATIAGAAGAVSASLMAIIIPANELIAEAQVILDQIHFSVDCPLDDVSASIG